MSDGQILLTAHLTFSLNVLRHTRRHKYILPPIPIPTSTLIAHRVPLHISLSIHPIADLDSRHCLVVTIYICQADIC